MVDLDQYFKVTITSDKMRAIIYQKKELPADVEVTPELIMEFSKKKGIVYGINEKILLTNQKKEWILAKGKAPTHGKHAYMEQVFKEQDKEELSENVDYKLVLDIVSVKKGDLIGRKIKATDGDAGINVLGEEIPPQKGKDFKLRAGKNTQLKENEQALYALIDGQLSVRKKTIHVLPTFEVNGDMSLKTGNIDFVGNVIVRGNVPPGFKVEAGGDIHVTGTVEAAILKAGGSIHIALGIVGQNKSVIEASGDLQTTFINQGDVHVGGNIEVGQTIFHSTCTAGGQIICNKGKGLIVGGSTSAIQGIQANEIGNDMQTNTLLFIGVRDHEVKQNKKVEADLKKAKDEFMKLAKLLKLYVDKEKKDSLTDKEKMTKLKIQRSFQQAKVTIDELSEITVNSEKEEDVTGGFIRAERIIYPNVEVHFGKYRRKVTATHRTPYISLIDSEVVIASH